MEALHPGRIELGLGRARARTPFVRENRARHFVGTAETVVPALGWLAADTEADEVMLTTMSHCHDVRVRPYRLLMEAWRADG